MKTKEFCLVCQHIKEAHSHRVSDVPRLDDICWDCDAGCWDKYHTFKLNNLNYVEDVAREKGLI